MFNFTQRNFSAKHMQNIYMYLNVNFLDVKPTYLPNIERKKIFGAYEYKHTIIQKKKEKGKKKTGKKKSQEI